MKSVAEKYAFSLLACLVISLAHLSNVNAQKVLGYGPDEPTAAVNYEKALYSTYKSVYSQLPAYPIQGAYSPTHFSNPDLGIVNWAGACNYIYIPAKDVLAPGKQYRISLTVKFGKAYAQMPYFQKHFGVALSSDLPENDWGLWIKHFIPLNINKTEELVTVDFIFRPLCTSKYLLLGVFQDSTMDTQDCFLCPYGFELHNLAVEVWNDPNAEFVYMCDAFEEERLNKKFTTGYETDTVYFDSGSAQVQSIFSVTLDSIPAKLRTKQDLISLYAYTDKNGNENDILGAARNEFVRQELISRGIDSNRILTVNYGETRASNRISQEDRRVEIDINRGKLYQKYYTEALEAAAKSDYQLAQAKITKWVKMVPPENAIYALFDCWGEGEQAIAFRQDLAKSIKSRLFYKGKDLNFLLDSLSCEDQKGRTLPMLLSVNRLPDFSFHCNQIIDSLRQVRHDSMVDRIYAEYGFPSIEKVGARCNQVLPFMIIHSKDTIFQNRYLPILRKACEEQLIDWEHYATLYDKINIARDGRQRYGTQWKTDEKGKLLGLFPFEDEAMVGEYRNQVGLVPLSDYYIGNVK